MTRGKHWEIVKSILERLTDAVDSIPKTDQGRHRSFQTSQKLTEEDLVELVGIQQAHDLLCQCYSQFGANSHPFDQKTWYGDLGG